MSPSATAAKARTPLERALADGNRSARADRLAMHHAVSAKSYSGMATAFKLTSQRLDSLHTEVSRANPANNREKRAKPLILSALKYGARGYAELHAAFHSAATDSDGHQIAHRLKLHRDAKQNLKTAEAAGAHARRVLGGR